MLGDPDEVTTFSPKPRVGFLLLGILGSLVFTVLGFWMVTTAKNAFDGLAGFASIAFFGGGGIAFAWNTRSNPRRLTFTPQGLLLEDKVVEWTNVEAIGITKYQSAKYNTLRLRDPSRFRIADEGNIVSQLGRLNRNWWGGEIVIGWAQRDRGAEEFGRLLEAWHAKYG